MLIGLHVFLALTSLGLASYRLLVPRHQSFATIYGLIALTLASGTYLTVKLGQPLASACLAGLMYLGIVAGLLIAAHYRLASQRRAPLSDD